MHPRSKPDLELQGVAAKLNANLSRRQHIVLLALDVAQPLPGSP